MRCPALSRLPRSAAPALALVLCVAACSSENKGPELTPEQQQKVAPYMASDLPPGMIETNINFDNKITLLGYTISPRQAAYLPGRRVEVMLVWRVEKPLDPGYQLFTHLLGEDGQMVLNVDTSGPLRQMKGFEGPPLPPSAWRPGRLYIDPVRFLVPGDPSPTLVVAVGIAHPEKGRLPIVGQGADTENRTSVIRLRTGVRPGKVNLKSLTAHKLPAGTTLTLDGRLDEPAWADARTTGSFVDAHSGRPNPAIPVQGSARLLWDDTHLYAAFEVKDQHLTGGFPAGTKDPHLWERDTVEIMIDPDGDGDNKDYYEIQINPQNMVFDSQFDDYNQPRGGPDGPFGHEEWSANLESAVALQGTLDDESDLDQGYTVEARIPWASFTKAKRTPPNPGDVWRMNFYAMQKNGGTAWAPLFGEGNFHRASRFGRVKFALPPGETAPSTAPSASPSGSASASAAAASASVKSAPAPSVSAGPQKRPNVIPQPPVVRPPAPTSGATDGKTPGVWAGHPDR